MTQQEEVRKKARRDLLLILLVLPFGILCMFFAGGAAIKLIPAWVLEADLGSKIDPKIDFVFKGTPYVMEQISADILTPVAWDALFLTPNAYVPPAYSPPVAAVPPSQPSDTAPPATEAPVVDVSPTAPAPTEPPPSGGGPPPPPPPPPPPTSKSADLDIVMTSGNTTYIAGGNTAAGTNITYSITVTNNGSVSVPNATLSDAKPAQVDQWVWCEGSPCTPTITPTDLDLSTSITLASGASVTYTVTANIKSPLAAANLVNAAKVTMPAGYIDPDTGTNTDTSNTVTIPPNINLSISKTSSTSTYSAGGVVPYQVVVTNNSNFNLTGVKVSDNIPDAISGWLWVCTATNATCSGIVPSVQFTSDFSDTVSINAGGNISYSVSALIVNPSGAILVGNLENTATVSEPVSGLTDSDSVTHTSAISTNIQIGSGDNVPYPVTEGTSLTLYLSQPIVTGHAGPDFVFYEYLNPSFPPSRVYLDHVIVSISQTGSSWVTVFNWGDNNPDTNTNVNIADGADIQTACPTETDNCEILPAFLYPYPGWGITIDIDSIVSSGNYPWIRFEAPSGSDDAAQIDAIEILH